MLSIIAGLAWKIAATAGVVVLVSHVARRSGPLVASIVVGLPIAAGPGFLFLVLDHDAAFIAHSALACFASTGLILVFTAVYARMAPWTGYLGCILAAALAWLAGALVLERLPLSLGMAFGCIAAGAAFAWLLRRPPDLRPPKTPLRSDWRLLAMRAGIGGLAVGGVATLGSWLGPDLAGLALGYPFLLTVTCWVIHNQLGGAFAAAMLTGLQRSVASFASFVLVLALLSGTLHPLAAWSLGIVISAAVAAAVAGLHRFTARPPHG